MGPAGDQDLLFLMNPAVHRLAHSNRPNSERLSLSNGPHDQDLLFLMAHVIKNFPFQWAQLWLKLTLFIYPFPL